MKPKSIFASKTLAFQAFTLAAAFFPPVTAFIRDNTEASLSLVVVINTALRFATKGRVSLFE